MPNNERPPICSELLAIESTLQLLKTTNGIAWEKYTVADVVTLDILVGQLPDEVQRLRQEGEKLAEPARAEALLLAAKLERHAEMIGHSLASFHDALAEFGWPAFEREHLLLPVAGRRLGNLGYNLRQVLSQGAAAHDDVGAALVELSDRVRAYGATGRPLESGNALQPGSKSVASSSEGHGALSHMDDAVHLPPSRLAEISGVPLPALRQRLLRFRKKSQDGWMENPDATAGAEKYLFRLGSVRYLLTP